MSPNLIYPQWPAPANVRAVSSTRLGGVSPAPFTGLNLGDHVEDDPENVTQNRQLLMEMAELPSTPVWLQQVHGVDVKCLPDELSNPCADAAMTRTAQQVCAVMTADCLPVLFCDQSGSLVAAAHAGWRGLCDGVLEATVAAMRCAPEQLLAWFGPAISANNFEVGEEVRQAFVDRDAGAAQAFVANERGRWQADLTLLARQRLNQLGVSAIFGGEFCTFGDAERFYSYRRDGQTGRMASIIWLDNTP